MIRRVFIVVCVVAGLLGLLYWSQRGGGPLRVSGFIEAHEARVGSRVGGRVKAVRVEEGQMVRPGDALVELEPFDLPARRALAAAEVAQRQAALEELLAGYRPEELAQARARDEQSRAMLADLERGSRPQEIAAARAQLDEAQAALQLAHADHARIASLFERTVTSREELDSATRNLRTAEAALEARRQAVALLEAGARADQIVRARAQVEETSHALALLLRGYRKEDVAQARAAVDGARAQESIYERQIEELSVRATIAGRVEAVDLRPGDLVAPDAPILTLLDLSDLWVRAYVPEDRLNVKVGQAVWVTVDSFPGERFAGRLTFLARQSEFTPHNVQTPEDRSKQVLRIKVTLDDGRDRLHPGMSADVWFDAEAPGA
jgi:multidrug resistance efflux pump